MTQRNDPWVAALHPQVSDGATTQPGRPTLVVQGPGAPTVTDDPSNKQTVLTFPEATVQTKAVDAGSAPITKGYAAMMKNGKLTLASSSALATSLYIAGLVLAAATAGQQAQIITSGLVDPTVLNVGAGVACAVGLDTNGKPVRVTDPTCVSGLKYVGVCDTNGAIYVSPRTERTYSVLDYGARADADGAGAGTDLGAVLNLMIGTLGITDITMPKGRYRIATTVVAHTSDPNAAVRLRGEGAGVFGAPTALFVDTSVTAFVCPYPNAQASQFRDFWIGAIANNATTTTGAWTLATRQIVVSSIADFVVGQVVRLAGVGGQTPLPYVLGTVTSGANLVTLSEQNGFGLQVGDLITLGSAYPTATKITAINTSVPTAWVLTMASNAAANATNAQVNYCFDGIGRITSIAGTTVTLDAAMDHVGSGSIPATLANVTMSHADTAFYIGITTVIDGVYIGGGDINGVMGFAGAGYTLCGMTTDAPPSNCDLVYIANSYVQHCRHAVYTRGDAANVCRFIGISSVQSRGWSFCETAFLGNVYIGCHADGGFGFITTAAVANASVFVGCYCEGGTFQALGQGSLWLAGTGATDPGGTSITNGKWNKLLLGDVASEHVTECLPNDPNFPAWARWFTHAGGTMTFARSDLWGRARSGWGVFLGADVSTWIGFNFDDASFKAGCLVFPRGFLVGDVPNNTFNPSSGFCIRLEARNDYSTLIASDPNTGTSNNTWHVADLTRMLVLTGGYESATCIIAGAAGVAKFRPSGALGGYETLSAAGTGNKSILETDAAFLTECLELTGVLTGARNIQLPNSQVPYKRWIFNNTSGAFALTVQALAGGNSVAIAQGMAAWVVFTGTEVRRMTADVTP